MSKDDSIGVAVHIILEQQKEMRDEQRLMQSDIKDIKEQTTKTNGRVTTLEELNKRADQQKEKSEKNLKWWLTFSAQYLAPWIGMVVLAIIAYFK